MHADGRPYGTPPPASYNDVVADAESAIRNLGFSAAHARQAVSQARSHVGSAPTIQELVRAALRAPRSSDHWANNQGVGP